jgi:hypothetical protein
MERGLMMRGLQAGGHPCSTRKVERCLPAGITARNYPKTFRPPNHLRAGRVRKEREPCPAARVLKMFAETKM